MNRLLVINGHPDPRPERFCDALSAAYAHGAKAAGWQTRRINVGNLPLSSPEAAVADDAPDADVCTALQDIEWANRLAIVYPLWFDAPPDTLSALFDHLDARRRAQVIVTMEMPAFAYRSLLRTGGRSKATGLSIPSVEAEEPVLIGCVNSISRDQRRGWLDTVRHYGEKTSFGTTTAPSRSLAFAAMIDRTVAQWWNAFT